ncbi:MAG: polymerase sigma-70 factor, subfamily [Myxococcales bacterium]|nr:polymerase sigma-70 factor, subfamily [Myxococcales bacterium]
MTAPAHVGGDMHAMATTGEPATDPVVELITAGKHREALTTCARTHHVVLGRLCMALLGSKADADEAVQETLLRAHRAMPTYRGEGSVKAWLCGIARHVCAHVLETRRRGREILEVVPIEEEARDAFTARRRARVIREGLEKLKPSERDVLVLRYVADLSHREIAVACGVDEAAARKRISRALARLRSVMPTGEIES